MAWLSFESGNRIEQIHLLSPHNDPLLLKKGRRRRGTYTYSLSREIFILSAVYLVGEILERRG